MRIISSVFLLAICAVQSVVADSPITFTPKLTSSWVLKADQEMPAQKGLTGHIVVVQNTNLNITITVTSTLSLKTELEQGLEQNAWNYFGGLVDSYNEKLKGKITREKILVKDASTRKIAEVSCRIKFSNRVLYFYGNCWHSKDRLICWAAIGDNVPVSGNKQIEEIGESIRVAE